MTKKLIILLLAIAPIAAFAQNAKLAHINTSELFNQMPEIPGIETQLNTKQEEISKTARHWLMSSTKNTKNFKS